MNTLKIALIGEAQVGKTSFVNVLLGKQCPNNYVATLGVEVHPITRGKTTYNIWDCTGNEIFKGLVDGYYVQSDGAIVMMDPTNQESVMNAFMWANDFKRVVPNAKVIYVLNKKDLLHNTNYEGWSDNVATISCVSGEGVETILPMFNP